MYKALEVALHIVNYCNDHGYSVSNLKLQKLLYFVQAYFLIASSGKFLCFADKIEAWDFGPVVPSVYSAFKKFGSTDIPKVSSYYESSLEEFFNCVPIDFRDNVISNEDKKLIDDVIEKFKNYTATDLVRITHNQATWKDAYAKGRNNIIEPEAIRNYFVRK